MGTDNELRRQRGRPSLGCGRAQGDGQGVLQDCHRRRGADQRGLASSAPPSPGLLTTSRQCARSLRACNEPRPSCEAYVGSTGSSATSWSRAETSSYATAPAASPSSARSSWTRMWGFVYLFELKMTCCWTWQGQERSIGGSWPLNIRNNLYKWQFSTKNHLFTSRPILIRGKNELNTKIWSLFRPLNGLLFYFPRLGNEGVRPLMVECL